MSDIGVYDVVLPFLVIFTLVYAFLEKTQFFGKETFTNRNTDKTETTTRKNLNAMIAFSIALFVVASLQLVEYISIMLSRTVLVLVIVFAFMLLYGALTHDGSDKSFALEGWTKTFFLIFALIAVLVIFLDAVGWMDYISRFIKSIWSNESGGAVVLLVLLGGIMWLVMGGSTKSSSGDKQGD
ncbi:MAG: hypothetical protein H6502_03770 [Candidatus Woesearchaeota archaeon]|nr:MAG: hypothetical protein H6502_03770 [Candidatus Woesearchaeota archaeon]